MKLSDDDWTPSEMDIQWQKNMLNMLKDDANWIVPNAMSVYQIDKRNKTFRLIMGDPTSDTNRRIATVFAHMRWTRKILPTVEPKVVKERRHGKRK